MKQCKTNQEVSSDLLIKGIRLTVNEFLILEEFSCRAGNLLKMSKLLALSAKTVVNIFSTTTFIDFIKTQMRKSKKSYRTKFSPMSIEYGVSSDLTKWRNHYAYSHGNVRLGKHLNLACRFFGLTTIGLQKLSESVSSSDLTKWRNHYVYSHGNARLGKHANLACRFFGLTTTGLQKLSESVRDYTYLILMSRTVTRGQIVGYTVRNLDTQRVFVNTFESVINRRVDIPKDIQRLQKTLEYAGSKVDYGIGESIYMLASDMNLRIEKIKNYNSKILISSPSFKIGTNLKINLDDDKPIEKDKPDVTYKKEENDDDKHTETGEPDVKSRKKEIIETKPDIKSKKRRNDKN